MIVDKYETLGTDPAAIQLELYEISKEVGIGGKDAFAAIYLSLIGKTHGPRAGLLLSNFGKDKVLSRFKEVINL